MVVGLRGVGNDRVRLAVMSQDLSLVGFSNRSGHWHAFPGHEHLLPGSTPLPFGNSYRDLIGGLPNLPLGRPATLQATGALSGPGHRMSTTTMTWRTQAGAGDPDGDLK
jgi:hypothetical protein